MTPEALISEQRLGRVRKRLILGLLLRGFPWYGWHSANFLLKVLQARLECSHRCGLTYVCSSRWVRTGPACADAGQRAVLYHSVRFSHFCSSFLLQQLKPVLCIVRSAMSSINSLTVVYEKHQILPDRQTHKHMYMAQTRPRETAAMFERFLPGSKSWWWWWTNSALSASVASSWDAFCRTDPGGSAPRTESPAVCWWCKSSVKISYLSAFIYDWFISGSLCR